ncbi:hypothetical protein [Streptomyces olivaceoviridis]|uniref:hypothetical protein n=1 Tax=Streptomyces olivaceoviridis TaxID=1921 RepID=UPI00332AA185
MRNVISTNSSADVSEEYAEQVEQLLESLTPERETTQDDELGQAALFIRLYTYEAPGSGETMWAVDYSDPASRELEETTDPAEAAARYEEAVRDSARNLGYDREGNLQRFTTTDVDRVPGPLPDLPDVTPDDVEALIDQDGTPVLYLTLDGDETVVKVGQAEQAPAGQVLLTREQVLHDLALSDDQGRVTVGAASREPAYGVMVSFLADKASQEVQSAADCLFPVTCS